MKPVALTPLRASFRWRKQEVSMSLITSFWDWMTTARKSTAGGLLWLPGGGGTQSKVAGDAAQSIASVYAAVHAYADSISSMDLAVVQKGAEEFEPAPHYLNDILGLTFNKEENSQQAVAYLVSSLELQGNAYSQIRYNRAGRVIEIIPQHPEDVVPQRTDDEKFYKINGFTGYLPDREAIHVHINYDRKQLRGISPLAYADRCLSLAVSMESFASRFFGDGARPDIALEHPGKLTQEQQKQILENFRATLTGAGEKKTALLHGGLKLHQLTISPEDSQFLESRRFTVNEIARFFSLPASRIGGDRSSGTYANLEQDQQAFLLHSIKPVCRMFEREFTRKLLTPIERQTLEIRFDLDDLLIESGVMDAPENTETTPPETADIAEDENADE